MELKTPRLVLRPFCELDLDRFIEVAGARGIADTTISVPHPLTETVASAWIKRSISETQSGVASYFAVSTHKDTERLIGYVAIKAIDREHNEGELSFWLDEHYAGNGYATEAANTAIAFDFDRLGLNRICAYHMVRNPASGRILKKLGFTCEGRLRQRVRKWNLNEDVLVGAKLADLHESHCANSATP